MNDEGYLVYSSISSYKTRIGTHWHIGAFFGSDRSQHRP